MKRKSVCIAVLAFLLSAVCGWAGESPSSIREGTPSSAKATTPADQPYNRLIHEKSPYLLQHAHNPIHWYPWGEEAFAAARAQNKPIFLSIGYSTCHWCHVMEKESFENKQVAKLLNAGYICIKVDREELPNVDRVYMGVVQAMTGRGGWPMTVVMTPDRIPFFGGTYFPREQLINIIQVLHTAWEKEPDRIQSIGRSVRAFLESTQNIQAGTLILDEKIFKKVYHVLKERFDPQFGGFGNAPKFPPTMKLMVLMRIARRTGNPGVQAMVDSTLEHMARGGIYDHLGGGFHRYSTDRIWLVPHFEKMLYNQASLAWVYLEGYQVTRKPMFESVARGILDYVLRDMTGGEGGFYSAEDADSAGEEGTCYVWSDDELKKILTPDEYQRFSKIYGVSAKGNFGSLDQGTNILHLEKNFSWQVKADPAVNSIHKKLLAIRNKRVHPFKDDKIITAWNGLMLASMAKAYQVLGDSRYLAAAQNTARFIKNHLYKGDRLSRRYRLGEVKHAGALDDYAYLIQGLIALYEADFDEGWIQWAQRLQKKQDELFWDSGRGAYFSSEKDDPFLPVRRKEFGDDARPNSNAVAALNLLQLYNLTFEKEYRRKAGRILTVSAGLVDRHPAGFAQMLIALDFYLDRSKEVAVVGPPESPAKKAMLRMLHSLFVPNKVLAYLPTHSKSALPIMEDKSAREGETMVYVCENNICKYPTTDIAKVRKLVEENKRYVLE